MCVKHASYVPFWGNRLLPGKQGWFLTPFCVVLCFIATAMLCRFSCPSIFWLHISAGNLVFTGPYWSTWKSRSARTTWSKSKWHEHGNPFTSRASVNCHMCMCMYKVLAQDRDQTYMFDWIYRPLDWGLFGFSCKPNSFHSQKRNVLKFAFEANSKCHQLQLNLFFHEQSIGLLERVWVGSDRTRCKEVCY